MKNKGDVKIQGKPAFYAVLFNSFKNAALDCGYALAIHGSMHSDLDLMAMPWVEDAKSPDELIKALDDCVGQTVWKDFKWKQKTIKPHGRISYTLSILGDWFIDLSVMPPTNKNIMTAYTLAFIFDEDLENVLLIKKNRPEWQNGYLNGIGGKCEPNEPPLECIKREVYEECGLIGNSYEKIGIIEGLNYIVYVYNSMVGIEFLKTAKSKTDEHVEVYSISRLNEYSLLPSVKYLIPMAMQPYIDHNFMSFVTKYE